jgi:O-antigen ligase/polysaccharide polymerase Wzy-like membrane protein
MGYRVSAPDWRVTGRPLFRLQATLIGLLCFSAGAVPRLLPTLLGLLGLVAAIHVLVVDPKRPLKLLTTSVGIALTVFIAYLFINATWAPDRAAGLAKAAGVLGLAVAVFVIAASYCLRSDADARVLAKSALIGLLIGAAFLLIELAFDEPIMRFVNNNIVQLLDITPKKAKVVDGEVTRLSAFILNRNVTSLVLLLIPALLFTLALTAGRARQVGLVALIAATATCVLISESGTSVVAFFVGTLVLGLGSLSLRATRIILAGAWTIATLLAVPLSAQPYDLGWHHWTWLPPKSVAARFYIWKHMADEVYKQPFTGIGIRGTRTLRVTLPPDVEMQRQPTGATRGRRATHAHNVFLQTWLELGAIGAVLLLGVGLAALRQMRNLPPLLQGSSYALFATCFAIGVSGFDLWQTWLLSAVALAWAAMLLATRLLVLAPPSVEACPEKRRRKGALRATIA